MLPLLSSYIEEIQLISIIGISVVISGFLLKQIKQPNLIAYILIGVIIGPSGLDLIADEEQIKFIGELGIILLFFFIGMEIDLRHFVKGWRLALFGTLGQLTSSIAVIYLLGWFYDWPINRVLVIGLVIALSSSAVVFKLLEEKNLFDKRIGQNVTNILLAQDIAIAPILIIIAMIGGDTNNSVGLPILGGLLFLSIIVFLYKKGSIKIPLNRLVQTEHELQVFLALFFCFSGALIASWFHISEALGAFIGGLAMHAGKATDWIHHAIHSFRILFVAVFFISIGAQLSIPFLLENWMQLTLSLIAVYTINHFINATILKLYNNSWSEAAIGGALLGQIGELSFLICLAAYNVGILTEYAYNFTLALISLTLLVSPIWILTTEKVVDRIT